MSRSSAKATSTTSNWQVDARALRWPRSPLIKWSFLAFAAIILTNLNGVIAVGARVGQVFTLVLFGLSLVILLAAGVAPKRDLGAPGLAYFTFLAVYIAIGSLVNSFTSGVQIYVSHLWMLSAGALAVCVSAVATRRLLLAAPREGPLAWLALLACIPVVMVYVDFLWPGLHQLLPRSSEERGSGFFADPNDAGVAINGAAVFCLGCLAAGRRRLLPAVALAACGIASILTFSRTAIIVYCALLVGAFLFPRAQGRAANRGMLIISAGLAIAVFAWFLMYGVYAFSEINVNQQRRIDNITDLAQGQNLDVILSKRLPMARLGLEYWRESPLVGRGLGVGTSMEHPGGHIGTHNTWLLVLVDAGVLPALLLALFAGVWLAWAWRCHLPAVRMVAIGFFIVFWLTTLSLHTALTKRYLNVGVGVVVGLMAADRQLQRRRRALLRQDRLGESAPAAAQPRQGYRP